MITFIGNSLDDLKNFPLIARREAGYQLDKIQRGEDPTDWKPMNSIGQNVHEIRIQHGGQYRIIYITKFKEAVYVLHAFQKKSQKTTKMDLETAKRALKKVQELHK